MKKTKRNGVRISDQTNRHFLNLNRLNFNQLIPQSYENNT